MDLGQIVYKVSIWAIPVLLAITLHEAAHGWVAWKLGDDTAKRLGRVTFNPLKHIDLFGTVLLPLLLLLLSRGGMMFGFAKPVPVNLQHLGNIRRNIILVAIAGPGVNLVLAMLSAATFYLLPYIPALGREWVFLNLQNSILINLILCVFNMLPLPPLDGGRVMMGLLPEFLARHLMHVDRYGIFIILGVLFILPMIGHQIGINLNIFQQLIGIPVKWLYKVIGTMLGLI